MKNWQRNILGMAVALSLVACATSSPDDKYKGKSAKQLFSSALHSTKKKNFKTASSTFEALDARFPFGEYAEKEQLYVIYTYYKDQDYASSLASAERFIHLHPDSEHIDYAYFMQGVMTYQQNLGVFERYFPANLADRDLTPAKVSFIDFSTLVRNYPSSAYVPNAIEYMTYLRNMFAKQSLDVARFYYDRKSYIAAINRANAIIKHYQKTPSVQGALHIAIKSYNALNLNDISDLYQSVYDLNFSQP